MNPSRPPAATAENIAEVRDLELRYRGHGMEVRALRGASLEVRPGESVGLLGESGSGKSTVARALIGLLPETGVRITRGQILIDGEDVTAYREREWRRLRGQKVAMVFQDPLTFLNPVMRVDRQIGEGVAKAQRVEGVGQRVRDLLDLVRLPREAATSYAHELSGGMRQRALIAMALSRDPELLVADEPTTALDVTTQQAILSLLAEIRRERDMALLFVSHDLAVISQVCERVYVMYAGQMIEEGRTAAVFEGPTHPYTTGLLKAAEVSRDENGRFTTIPGTPRRLTSDLTDCGFASRCPYRHSACDTMPDPFVDPSDRSHRTRCWLPAERAGDVA